MIVEPGFCECAEVAHAFVSPKLARTFEAALPLAASRLASSRANGPAATMNAGMKGKIVLFAPYELASFSFGHFQSGYLGAHFLFASMPQLVA